MQLFDRPELERLIKLMASKLNDLGVIGTISLVGGAAISLGYLTQRESTTDIDALLPNHPAVSKIITKIASAENLEMNWINDAALAFVPFETQNQWVDLYRFGGILVRIATAELLLAMKLRADRGRRDRADIAGLIRLCGITSIAEVEELYETFHHQEVLSHETREVVIKMLLT